MHLWCASVWQVGISETLYCSQTKAQEHALGLWEPRVGTAVTPPEQRRGPIPPSVSPSLWRSFPMVQQSAWSGLHTSKGHPSIPWLNSIQDGRDCERQNNRKKKDWGPKHLTSALAMSSVLPLVSSVLFWASDCPSDCWFTPLVLLLESTSRREGPIYPLYMKCNYSASKLFSSLRSHSPPLMRQHTAISSAHKQCHYLQFQLSQIWLCELTYCTGRRPWVGVPVAMRGEGHSVAVPWAFDWALLQTKFQIINTTILHTYTDEADYA